MSTGCESGYLVTELVNEKVSFSPEKPRDSSVGRAVDCRRNSSHPSVTGSIPVREISFFF